LETTPVLLGIEFGLFYGVLAIALLSSGILQKEKQRQSQLLRQLNLKLPDMLFLSFCAGFGEELLFRIGIQFYLGPFFTALLFVALHGYYDPRNWRVTLYGILLTPFILLLGYSVDYFGIWFAIAAHTAYDVLLFMTYGRQQEKKIV
jgi:membrane protease YdiL (CAAX protease family)